MRKSATACPFKKRLYEDPRILTIDTVTVQLKPSVIEDKIDTAASLLADISEAFPDSIEVVSEDILFGGGEMIAASGLEGFDLLFGHVDEEGKIGRVAPETYW